MDKFTPLGPLRRPADRRFGRSVPGAERTHRGDQRHPGGLIHPARSETGWRLAFLAGLFVAPLVHVAFGGTLPAVTLNAPLWLLIVAGLIVGLEPASGRAARAGTGSAG